jgi:hypothetical protein
LCAEVAEDPNVVPARQPAAMDRPATPPVYASEWIGVA